MNKRMEVLMYARKNLLWIIALVLLALACNYNLFSSPLATLIPTEVGGVELANPASKYCLDQGGSLEIRTDAQGNQYGMCIFDDGSECDEWAYFRGECKPGDSLVVPTIPAEDSSGELTFQVGAVAFQYPQEWQALTNNVESLKPAPAIDMKATYLAGIWDTARSPGGFPLAAVLLLSKEIPSGSTLRQVYDRTYLEQPQIIPVGLEETVINLSGREAINRRYRVFWGEPAYEFRDIWFAVDGVAYILFCHAEWTNPEDMEIIYSVWESVIQSLTIKE